MTGQGRYRWWGISGIMAGILLAFLGWGLFQAVRRDEIGDPAELDTIYRAAGTMAAQDLREGRKPVVFPHDMGVASSHAYFDLLAQRGYVSARDRKRLDDFVIANVAAGDPAETAFLVSRSYYDAWLAHQPLPSHYIVLLKYGQACVAAGNGVALRLPKREPVFLEP